MTDPNVQRLTSGSLSRRLLISLGASMALAIALLSALVYTNSAAQLEARSLDTLRAAVSARAREGGEVFGAAQRNTQQLRDEYVRRLAEAPETGWRDQFRQWFERYPDELVRVRPALDDHRRLPTVYLRPQVELNDDVMRRTQVAFDLLREWGPVMTQRHYSAYFDLPGEGLIMYSPSVNWGAEATPESNNFDYPPVAGASPRNNPGRTNRWTPVYFDDKAGIFMVSTVTPIDLNRRWIACVSQDVSIDELLNRTLGNKLPGSFNLIYSREGKLIVHPEFEQKIRAAQGNLALSALRDPLLAELAELEVPRSGEVALARSRDGAHILAVANIDGPDWIYATVYPVAQLRAGAFDMARFILVAGVLALLLMLGLLHLILRRQISLPVLALQSAAGQLARGQFDVALDTERDDELGQLAASFVHMRDELQAREISLQGAARTLEDSHRQIEQQLERLRASEEKFRVVFDQSPVMLLLQRSPSGELVDINGAGLALLGGRLDDWLGRSLAGLGWQFERDGVPQLQALDLVGEPRLLDQELQMRLPGGRTLGVLLSRSPIQIGAERFSLLSIRDTSERQQAEVAARRLEDQLRESQKMEAVGTLAGGIAHDFNNILGAMLGNLALARVELPARHPVQALMEQVHRGAIRARDLVRQILAFSSRQPRGQEVMSMQAAIDEAVGLLRASLPARVKLETRLCSERLALRGDPTQIQQVLMNLCTNAWHAMQRQGGRIVVGLEPVSIKAETLLGGGTAAVQLAPGEYLHLWVADDGAGMDAATQARIFEPFFTTKGPGQGTGLGLSMVHGIVSAHQGLIGVDSQRGQGSTFHLYFPRAEAPPDPQGPASALETAGRVPEPTGHGEQVLYVDDDEVMCLMVERLLARAGYRVSCCTDAQQALSLVAEDPRRFELVLTDYNMPGLSGLELAIELRRLRPQLPVVISSGHVSDELQAGAERAGIDALLQKEDTFEDLAGVVHRVLSARAAAGR